MMKQLPSSSSVPSFTLLENTRLPQLLRQLPPRRKARTRQPTVAQAARRTRNLRIVMMKLAITRHSSLQLALEAVAAGRPVLRSPPPQPPPHTSLHQVLLLNHISTRKVSGSAGNTNGLGCQKVLPPSPSSLKSLPSSSTPHHHRPRNRTLTSSGTHKLGRHSNHHSALSLPSLSSRCQNASSSRATSPWLSQNAPLAQNQLSIGTGGHATTKRVCQPKNSLL